MFYARTLSFSSPYIRIQYLAGVNELGVSFSDDDADPADMELENNVAAIVQDITATPEGRSKV